MRRWRIFIYLYISEALGSDAMSHNFRRAINFHVPCIASVAGGDSTKFRPQRSGFIEKTPF